MTETWFKPTDTLSLSDFSDYNIFRRDRIEATGGGLLIAIKKFIRSDLIFLHPKNEILIVKITEISEIYFVLTYIPHPTIEIFKEICNFLKKLY